MKGEMLWADGVSIKSHICYSQSTSRVTWNCETEMNMRNPLCNFQHSNGMWKFSRKIAQKFAN